MTKRARSSRQTMMLNRRRFLGCLSTAPLLGLSASPFGALFSAIIAGQSEKAWASALGESSRKLVLIHSAGAPARYMFDQFLTPYGTEGFNPSPMIGTQFKSVGGRYIGHEYVTHSIMGIQAPTMWTHSLPGPSGTQRPMSELLKNLLSVQGLTTKTAGHEASALWGILAPGARRSAPALAGDPSPSPFAALNLGMSGFSYKSSVGKSAVSASTTTSGSNDPITKLLTPFKTNTGATFNADRQGIKAAYDSILPMFDEYSKQGHVGAQALVQNRLATLALIEVSAEALNAQWTVLLNKYQDLVSRAIYDPANPLPGINDLPIGEGGSGPAALYKIEEDGEYPLHLASDVRSVVSPSAAFSGLAASFALTEYVLLKGLSSSVGFSVGGLSGLLHPVTLTGSFSVANDQHYVGAYPSLYFNVLQFRALGACLLELITQLKAANLFSDTVIRYGGEFVRNTKLDMSGSDHGFSGAAYSHFCGAINGPVIIGNLTSNDSRLGWGKGGNVPELGRNANLVDLAILLAHLIKTDAPFTSETPVATLTSNGTIASRIGLTKHVPS
jgi:hypothetical protein